MATTSTTNDAPVPFIDLTQQYAAIADEIQTEVQELFQSQAFVLGEAVSDFEADIAQYCDSRHAIGCASGTDALLLSLMATNIGPGDEVITTPFTFFATAGAIHRAGAIPVFVDIDPETYNMRAEDVASVCNRKTRAIMPVHLFGQCVDMEPLWRVAIRQGLAIIEDACQAIGAGYHGRRAGVLGTTGCFSFFPTKNLGGAGDGGIITTDDDDVARRLKSLRVHGQSGTYMHREVGLNSRLDALQAVVLAVKLRHLDSWSTKRRSHAARYADLFDQYNLTDVIGVPQEQEGFDHVYNQYTIRVGDGRRDEIMQTLRDQGVGCNVYYPLPIHLQECFGYLSHREGEFPESERAAKEVLSLPIFPELTEAQQDRVVIALARALGTIGGTATKAA